MCQELSPELKQPYHALCQQNDGQPGNKEHSYEHGCDLDNEARFSKERAPWTGYDAEDQIDETKDGSSPKEKAKNSYDSDSHNSCKGCPLRWIELQAAHRYHF